MQYLLKCYFIKWNNVTVFKIILLQKDQKYKITLFLDQVWKSWFFFSLCNFPFSLVPNVVLSPVLFPEKILFGPSVCSCKRFSISLKSAEIYSFYKCSEKKFSLTNYV